MARIDPTLAVMATQERHQDWLLALRNVVGTATGFAWKGGKETDRIVVQVLVQRKEPLDRLPFDQVVPRELPGLEGRMVPTDVLEMPIPEAHQDTGRHRPVPAGCSIGPEARVSAGTLGGWACDDLDDTVVLLSNNHVISNLDTLPDLRRIVQPGRLDGGVLPDDVIGTLKRHIVLNTVANQPGANPANSVVDAAIGTIDVGRTLDLRQLNVPVIFELQAPALNMNVQKRGRTTQLTTNGRVTSVNVTTLITYRNRTRLARVQNSFIITSTDGNAFSNPGDSGSLILNQAVGTVTDTLPVVGLLYGGGENNAGTPVTIANDINSVFGALNLSTVCACVLRSLLRGLSARERMEGRTLELSREKERQFRLLRERLADSPGLAPIAERVMAGEAARLGKLLAEDDEAFSVLARALEPLVRAPTNHDLLETRLEGPALEGLLRFAGVVSRKSRGLRPMAQIGRDFLKGLDGKSLGSILRAEDPGFEKAAEPPAPPKKPRKPKRK